MEGQAQRSVDDELLAVRRAMEERFCEVRGSHGIVEKVYKRRGCRDGVFGAKVILDSGRIVYCDVLEVAIK